MREEAIESKQGNANIKTAITVAVVMSVFLGFGYGLPPPQVQAGHGGIAVEDGPSGSQDYEDNGNKKCTLQEELEGKDTDGDGTPDCDDPDDDGDLLTDELEDRHSDLYDPLNPDRDGDGILDVADLVPNTNDGALVEIIAKVYSSGNCDGGQGTKNDADPYIRDTELYVNIGAGGKIELEIPTGWSEGVHVEERAEDSVADLIFNSKDPGKLTAGILDLPDDIFQWPHTNVEEIPEITFTIGLIDHDVVNDDRMDLEEGTETKAIFEVPMTINDDIFFDKQGDEDHGDEGGICSARIGFDFDDTLEGFPIDLAVYHRVNPNELIGMGTI